MAWFSPTYENPRGFSIRFVFAKLVAETRNEIIHKHVAHNSGNHSDGIDLGTEMWIFK